MGTIPLPPTGAEYERVDDTPVELPTRLRLPQSRTDQMRAFIRHELSLQAQDQGHESFEEADDFEIDEEDAPLSKYELMDLEPPAPPELTPPLQNSVEAVGQPPVDPAASSEEPASPSPGGSDGKK